MEYFADSGETGNCQICTSVHRNKSQNRLRQMNGYAIWDDFETLDIFIADYKGDGTIYNMEKARVTSNLNLGYRFLRYIEKGDLTQTEESAAETEFISNFQEFKTKIMRTRIILLTDALTRSDFALPKTSKDEDIVFEVWDLQRIYQVWSSQGKRESIEIDLPEQFGQKLRFLAVEQEDDQYSAYLTVAPAGLLADLYNIYGTRLLEQNVRVYLQNLGKVNREIRKTILDSPGMFMAYNNGISATASDITFEDDSITGLPFIKRINGLQIVNGGQTTSSIFYARKKDRAELRKVNVQIKITCVNNARQMDQIVSKISKYANSQNKVSEIDLTSNQPFQIKLEELSRTTWANPAGNGNQQTRWFYERVKGQYKEELNKEHTTTRKNAFKLKNPSWQVLRKEEFAKYRNSWKLLPYWVARGSQKNYLHFVWQEKDTEPSRQYFKDNVAVAIFFKAAESIYGKKPNSMGDLRYLVVPYTVAWINYHTEERLNLSKIWNAQRLSDSLWLLLKSVLLKINEFFQQKPEEFALISEWGKREECWKALSSIAPAEMGINFELIAADLNEPIAAGTVLNRNTDNLNGLKIADWEKIETEGRERLGFDLFQINIIRNVIRRLKLDRQLTEQLSEQAVALLEIYRNAAVTT
ncbi:AIPR family protein [Mucilaginibacter sp. ZT4R22]|uniref:AIPR family protein n=2 Tax=Mucilaginibacter pankratovii TaxID=2772110 RepID=A0ABR7WKY9_9SPHI|nr:AIPR family protein [Mucilaginibacter pankratovii]MBD1362999.1 AIPR family protein [Mucilaginibacter pankratovii]